MIYLIIPVFNRKEFTRNCLLSLKNQTEKDFKAIIVNDGSTDGTSEMLANEFPEVHVIKADGNLWWTAATNLGVKYALDNNAEYIMTLNNDTEAEVNFLENFIKNENFNAIQGALWKGKANNEIIDGGSLKINWFLAKRESLISHLPIDKRKGLHEITHYSGRGLFIHKSVFQKIGLFDEKTFPHYGADQDFTMRAKREGIKLMINYDAVLYIYPEESGANDISQIQNIKGYFQHLFTIKGGGNLANFYKLAFRHCPKKYLPFYLFSGTIRRLFGFFISKRINSVQKNN